MECGDKDAVSKKVESPLRRRMVEDMDLAGLSTATKKAYVRAVCQLQKALRVRPDRLSEAEVRAYLLERRKTMAKGTFQSQVYGLKFFYYRVLDRDWSLFTKKKWLSPNRDVYPTLSRRPIVPACWARFASQDTASASPA